MPPGLQKSLRETLLSSATERDFLCRASYLVPPPELGSNCELLLKDGLPTAAIWARKRFLLFCFGNPAIQSPISTFGHSFLVATDRSDGGLELDAVVLEFTAEGVIDSHLALKSLTTGAMGKFHLRWFVDKQMEYDLKDRDLWLYPVRPSVRTPADLRATLERELNRPQVYRFAAQNCADRIFELFTRGGTSKSGTRLLAIPQEELREIVAAGWTLPPVLIKSLSSLCGEPLRLKGGLVLEGCVRKIRLLLRNAARAENPQEVERLRNLALAEAKRALSDPDGPVAHPDPAGGLWEAPALKSEQDPVFMRRGPDARFAGVSDSRGALGWKVGFRVGSFDFINGDPAPFQSSSLEILSAEASAWDHRPALRRLTLLRLDTLELETETAEGQVRFLEVGWNRIDGQSSAFGRGPSEAGLRFGAGFCWGWGSGVSARASLGPVAGVGASWNAPGSRDQARFTANLGLRGQVQVNSGRTPRIRLTVEWRGLEINAPYRSRVETVLVPWEFKWGSFYCGYTDTDHRWKEWSGGLVLPLR